MVEETCSGVSVGSEAAVCGSAKPGGVFSRRQQPGHDGAAKTLHIKVEAHSLPVEPEGQESKAEVLQPAPCTGADAKPESSGLPDGPRGAEDTSEDRECRTCAEESEMTSEVGRGADEFRPSTKSKGDAKLSEADASALPPKLEQSCGAEHLVASDQHQEAGLATSGQDAF